MDRQTNKQLLRERRKPFNEVCGILLLCVIFMFAAILVTALVQVGVGIVNYGLHGSTIDLDDVYKLVFANLQDLGYGYLVYSLVCLIVILVWKGKAFYKSAFHANRPMTLSVFLQLMCVFFSVQLVSTYVYNILEYLLNLWGYTSSGVLKSMSDIRDSTPMFLYAAVAAPIVEELLFRGAILQTLRPFGKRFAIVFSALLFGLFHKNLIQAPSAFLVGLILGYVAVEHSLVWCIVLHFLNNCVISWLLADYPTAQGLILLLFTVAALIVLTVHGNDLKFYHRSLHPMPKEAVRGFWTAPLTILLILICLASCIGTITAL